MATRSVEAVFAPPAPHMVGDGFRVHHFFPDGVIQDKQRMSPFFMLDYASPFTFTPTDTPRGVGVHPHRGFETVTIAYQGKIAHHDSAGNQGVIAAGDVQWMTAGSGVLHKEYHEKEFAEQGGLFQMVQLWVNLPKAHKMTTPRYQEITSAAMARYPLAGGEVEIIAGTYKEKKGPAATFSPVNLFNLHLQPGATCQLDFPAHYNTSLLVIKGTVVINDHAATANHWILMKNDGDVFQVQATEDCVVLVLSGEPLGEPIAAYGPFLMNSWSEIEQAVVDFNQGKFGVLADS
ncbi:MAG: pirin family protein [Chitinophagia bacterium]|nr:pirin family protein [Chitinophagia bacterium]